MTTTRWLSLTPRDTVFVRDGRSFDAAADGYAQTVRPGPTTVAGAVGAVFGTNPVDVRGPVLARRAGGAWEPYFPVPADLVVSGDRARRVYRLRPGGTDAASGEHTDLDGADRGGDSAPRLRMLVPPERAGGGRPVTSLEGSSCPAGC